MKIKWNLMLSPRLFVLPLSPISYRKCRLSAAKHLKLGSAVVSFLLHRLTAPVARNYNCRRACCFLSLYLI